MKPITARRLRLAGTAFITVLSVLSVPGQTAPGTSNAMLVDLGTTASVPAPGVDIRFDLVDARLETTTDVDHAYQRSVQLQADGRYHVRVTAAYGTVKMTGTYLDAALSKPDGDFTFHYADGSLESRGAYVSGLKTGIWERYACGGRRLAERVYVALDHDQLMEAMGMAEEVCTSPANAQ